MTSVSVSLDSGGLVSTALGRLGLVRNGALRAGRASAIVIAVAWFPLLILTALDGTLLGGVEVPFLRDPAVHARLLLALPLLLVSELIVIAAMRRCLGEVQERGILAPGSGPALDEAIAKFVRRRDSRLVELLIVGGTFAFIWAAHEAVVAERAGQVSSWMAEGDGLSRAGAWYFYVSLYVSFVMGLRWVWRITVWTLFLLGFLRRNLRPHTGHPDNHAGLASLTQVQGAFAFAIAALAVTVSGRLMHEVMYSGLPLKATIAPAGIVIAFAALVMFGPLLLFAPIVARARRRALVGYDRLGQEMLSAFEARWLGKQSDGQLLGDADPSSLIDFAGAYDEVRKTKPVPLDIRRALPALLVVALPFLPLLLQAMSLGELLKRVLKLLV
jgi:hypothetical protein